jgi:hypothetical protein
LVFHGNFSLQPFATSEVQKKQRVSAAVLSVAKGKAFATVSGTVIASAAPVPPGLVEERKMPAKNREKHRVMPYP